MILPILPFYLTVRRVTRLSPNFVRVTLGGEDLQDFGVTGPTYDLRVKVIISGDGELPDFRALLTEDNWFLRWREMDPRTRGYMRTYTVRAHRGGPEPELDIDFVLHLGNSSGPASRWANLAEVGQELLIIGPNRHHEDGRLGIAFSAAEGNRLMMVADETGVPAVAAIVESLPANAVGDVALEVPEDGDILQLSAPSGIAVRWFPRNGAERGVDLTDAVRALVRPIEAGTEPEDVDIDSDILWEVADHSTNGFYAFIAGEAGIVKTIRRYLVRDCGIDRKSVSFMGYWRLGRSEDS